VNILNQLVDLDEILYGGDDIKTTPMPYFLITYLQSFQIGGLQSSDVGAKKPPDNIQTDWWIWMKFCVAVMTLKLTLITPKWGIFKLLKRCNTHTKIS
jgi:hypothetical protein